MAVRLFKHHHIYKAVRVTRDKVRLGCINFANVFNMLEKIRLQSLCNHSSLFSLLVSHPIPCCHFPHSFIHHFGKGSVFPYATHFIWKMNLLEHVPLKVPGRSLQPAAFPDTHPLPKPFSLFSDRSSASYQLRPPHFCSLTHILCLHSETACCESLEEISY